MKNNRHDIKYYLEKEYNIIVEFETLEDRKWYIAYANELGRGSCYGLGDTHSEAIEDFIDSKNNFINMLYEDDVLIPEPVEKLKVNEKFSGVFTVRTTPLIHRNLAFQARANEVSLNAHLNNVFVKSISDESIIGIIQEGTKQIIGQLKLHHELVTDKITKYNVNSIENMGKIPMNYLLHPLNQDQKSKILN